MLQLSMKLTDELSKKFWIKEMFLDARKDSVFELIGSDLPTVRAGPLFSMCCTTVLSWANNGEGTTTLPTAKKTGFLSAVQK